MAAADIQKLDRWLIENDQENNRKMSKLQIKSPINSIDTSKKRIHNEIKTSLCKTCRMSYENTGLTNSKKPCKQCSTFLLNNNINSFETQIEEKQFKCNECEYACNQSEKLKIHMRIHSGDRPYKCNECEYTCNQSGDLKKHMRIHSGDRPYKCNECEYACSSSGNLKNHENTQWR